jgi:hypothetical protein
VSPSRLPKHDRFCHVLAVCFPDSPALNRRGLSLVCTPMACTPMVCTYMVCIPSSGLQLQREATGNDCMCQIWFPTSVAGNMRQQEGWVYFCASHPHGSSWGTGWGSCVAMSLGVLLFRPITTVCGANTVYLRLTTRRLALALDALL